jgi:hypothetical protein
MTHLFDKNLNVDRTVRSALFGIILFVSVFATGFLFFAPNVEAGGFCFSGVCLNPGFCNNSADCMGPNYSRDRYDSAVKSYCGTNPLTDACLSSWHTSSPDYIGTLRSGNPYKGSYCVKGDCVALHAIEIQYFAGNSYSDNVEINKGEELRLNWRTAGTTNIGIDGYPNNVPTDVANIINRGMGEKLRDKQYIIDSWVSSLFPPSDTTYTLSAYNAFSSPTVVRKTLNVKVRCEYGCCMKEVMQRTEKEAKDNWALNFACGGLKYGVQAAVTTFTGGAPILGGAAGGIMGGLCDVGVKMISLNKYKSQCDNVRPPDKKPEQVANTFLASFARELIVQMIGSFIQGLLGGFFKVLSCNPFIQGFMNFLVNTIAGAIGNFLANFFPTPEALDPNDPITWIGAAIGGGIGGAVGYEVGASAAGGLQSLIGFTGMRVDAFCPDVAPKKPPPPPPLVHAKPEALSPNTPEGALEVGDGITGTALNILGLNAGQIRAIDCVAVNVLIVAASKNVFGHKDTKKEDSSGKKIVEVDGGPFRSTNQVDKMAYLLGYVPASWNNYPLDWSTAAWDILGGLGFEPQDIVYMLDYKYDYKGKKDKFVGHLTSCILH